MDIAKILAILSVIVAHSRNASLGPISIGTERIGAIGVVLFLFISGYYFHPKSKLTLGKFIQKKIYTIFIPWIVTGTAVFVISTRDSSVDWVSWIVGWMNWIIGNGSYLYFLTILVSCYVLFYYVSRNNKVLLASVFVNVLSLIFTSFGVFENTSGVGFHINNYLNIFNWIGFFALGIHANKWLPKLLSFLNSRMVYVCLIYLCCLTLSISLEPNIGGYFSKLALPMEILGGITLLSISTLRFFDKQIFYKISKFTFAIYLTHFLVFPIRKLLGHGISSEFINPLIICAVNVFALFVGLKLSKHLGLSQLYSRALGIRQ